MKKVVQNNFSDELKMLLAASKEENMTVEHILHVLAGRGHAFLLIILSLPFCLPIQIPGFSTPFGLLLCFIGLRIAFGKHAWMPKSVLQKEVSKSTLTKIAALAITITNKLRVLVHSRLIWIVKNPYWRAVHGVIISILSLILALPLPIPLTNVLAAYPIFFFGLGLLEDDGLMIVVAYVLAAICFGVFVALIWFGKAGITALVDKAF